MAKLAFTRAALSALNALSPGLRDAVGQTLIAIEADPESAGKPLLGRMSGLWSCRVGSYRVIYSIEKKQVTVRWIVHRSVAYRRRRR